MAVLQAYLDESGRGQESAAYVVAGFIAPVEAWLKFGHIWQAELDRPPPIRVLKARLGMHDSYPERIDEFVKVIRGHVSFRTRITIPHRHYIKTFKGKVDKRFDNPFWVPTYSAIMVTLRFLAVRGITEKVNFIFDNAKTKEKKLIRSGWDFYKTFAAREIKPLIGDEPDFRADDTVLPLQAADMYAWHARQHALALSRGDTYKHPVWTALNSIPGAERDWSATDLKGVFDMIPRSREQTKHTLDPGCS
jgi:uncharacterized protein DUF3800